MKKQHYKFKLKVSKQFLKDVYKHPLLAEIIFEDESIYDKAWENKPEIEELWFGGKFDTQFETKEEIASFLAAFKSFIEPYGEQHRDNLIYYILFYTIESERQSLKNSKHNALKDYSDFLINLIINSFDHIKSILDNPDYKSIYDEGTKETIYAKRHLFDTMTPEDIVNYFPEEEDSKDDVIRYTYIKLALHNLQVPRDLTLAIISERNLKNINERPLPNIKLPSYLNKQILQSTVDYMLNTHYTSDSEFFKLIVSDKLSIEALKKYYNKKHKYTISNPVALCRLGIVIEEYLISNNIVTTKIDAAKFLHKYFAFFKLYQTDKELEFPADYKEYPRFYRTKHKISFEEVRLMMKNANKTISLSSE